MHSSGSDTVWFGKGFAASRREFQGWDKESVKVNNADVVFTGTWEFSRMNKAVLKDDFSAVQGTNGWYYGAADWNGANFGELPYDAA